VTVRFRPWALGSFLLTMLVPASFAAREEVGDLEHWRNLGFSAQEIVLIGKLRIPPRTVDRLASDGVSVRDYAHKPWLEMGLSEEEWFGFLEKGSDISSLEAMYDREDAQSASRPGLLVSFALPGYSQIREGNPVRGSLLAAGAVGFAALTFCDRQGGSIKFQWPLLWGGVSILSATDIWYRYYRAQSISGFSLEWRPGRVGCGWSKSW
jgi:hypothetical protein